jgi:hypothetical protein
MVRVTCAEVLGGETTCWQWCVGDRCESQGLVPRLAIGDVARAWVVYFDMSFAHLG